MSEAADQAFTYDPGENISFTEADLNGAVLSVNSKKMSIQDAASTFQIPILTLWNKVLNIKTEDNEEEILTKQEEAKIAQIMRDATDYGCHPSVEDFLYTVKSVLEKKGQFSTFKHRLGNDWILAFLDRHRGITLKPSENLKNGPGAHSLSGSSTHPSKMVLLDEKNVFLDCSIKKERLDEGTDETSSPEEALQKALVEVKLHGMNVFTAAKLHNVSPATLWDEVCGKDAANMAKQGSSSTALNVEEEAEIADMLRKAISRGLEVTRNDLRETVKAILDSKGRNTRFSNNRPSKWWVPSFLSRHPGINLKEFSCRPTAVKRSTGATQASSSEPAVTISDCVMSSSSPATDSNQPSSDKTVRKSSTASSSKSSHGTIANVDLPGNVISTASRNSQDGNLHTSAAPSKDLTATSRHSGHSTFPSSSNLVSSFESCVPGYNNTASSSTGVISKVTTVTSSTTMSHTDPLSAHKVSNGAVENGPKIHPLLEIPVGPTMSGATEDGSHKSQTSDSTFSLLKRLTMINFSLGEDRVLKFFSYLERGDKFDDVDYYYWKSLISRIMPSPFTSHSSAPAFNQESQNHFNPTNMAYNSAFSYDRFSSQPMPRSYEAQTGIYNHNNNNYYHRNSYKQQRFYRHKNYQSRYQHRKADAAEQEDTRQEEVAEVTHKEKEKKGGSEEKVTGKKQKKDKKEIEYNSHNDPDEKETKTIKVKNSKKKRKVEQDTDVEENNERKESKSKKPVKVKKKEKKDKSKEGKSSEKEKNYKKGKKKLASVREEHDEEEMNMIKKKKKKKKTIEKENPLIRVEVDMNRVNKRTVFNDSSSD